MDKTKSFGDTDSDGWVYGSSFEKIQEMIARTSTTGICSSTSLYRKRRWKRTMICVSKDIREELEARRENLTQTRRQVEEELRYKHTVADLINNYEKKRLVAQTAISDQTYNALSIVEDELSTEIDLLKRLKLV